MKPQNTFREKRKYPRINKRIAFKLKEKDTLLFAETIDLSCIGAYCQVNSYVPFLTRLKIVFELPSGNREDPVEYAECFGVVVRVEKILSETTCGDVYNMAIFFHEIEERERKKIDNFVKTHKNPF